MKTIELNEAEAELLIEALEAHRKQFDRETSRREDVTVVTAIDNLLEKLREG